MFLMANSLIVLEKVGNSFPSFILLSYSVQVLPLMEILLKHRKRAIRKFARSVINVWT